MLSDNGKDQEKGSIGKGHQQFLAPMNKCANFIVLKSF